MTVEATPGLHDRAFDSALSGQCVVLMTEAGFEIPIAASRWLESAAGLDEWLLLRCTGRTIDLGCGPGRLVAELIARGTPALGIDYSPIAVASCRARGGSAFHSDLFDPLPDEGTWEHVLLVDGNIGIGGDPAALLRRCARLTRPGGELLVETSPAITSTSDWSGRARLHRRPGGLPAGDWFPWALVTTRRLIELAARAEMHVLEVHSGDRDFVRLMVPRHR